MNRLELKNLELQEIQSQTLQLIAEQFIELNASNKELISSLKELIATKNVEPKIESILEHKPETKKRAKEDDILNGEK